MFSSMTRARSVNTRIALANTRKGDMTVTEYVGKMRSLADEMMFSGKPLDDEELISYILAGLEYYNPIVSAIVSRTDAISVGEVFSQLLSFEQRMELLQNDFGHSVNMTNRGRGGQ